MTSISLPDGKGVIVRSSCSLCDGALSNKSITCPICSRKFCSMTCAYAHLVARDDKDSQEAAAAYMKTHTHNGMLDAEGLCPIPKCDKTFAHKHQVCLACGAVDDADIHCPKCGEKAKEKLLDLAKKLMGRS
jgi:hypothetical protein